MSDKTQAQTEVMEILPEESQSSSTAALITEEELMKLLREKKAIENQLLEMRKKLEQHNLERTQALRMHSDDLSEDGDELEYRKRTREAQYRDEDLRTIAETTQSQRSIYIRDKMARPPATLKDWQVSTVRSLGEHLLQRGGQATWTQRSTMEGHVIPARIDLSPFALKEHPLP
jgi:hypothetical protein